MSKVPANTFLLLRKQAYSVGVENVRVQVGAASEMKNSVGDSSSNDQDTEIADQKNADKEEMPAPARGKKEEFWMRDPKTGNWMPESHINEVDVAELRDKFLPDRKAKH